jgi:hypothetical protein
MQILKDEFWFDSNSLAPAASPREGVGALERQGETKAGRLLVDNETFAAVAFGGDTCDREWSADWSDSIEIESHGSSENVPVTGLRFFSLARSFMASSHSLVRVLGGDWAIRVQTVSRMSCCAEKSRTEGVDEVGSKTG